MNKVFCLLLFLLACTSVQEQPEPTVAPAQEPEITPSPATPPKAQVEQIPDQKAEQLPEEDDKCYALGCPFGSIFVGDMKTDLYYACHCTFSKWIKPDDLLCFDSEAEAEERGYRPAQSC